MWGSGQTAAYCSKTGYEFAHTVINPEIEIVQYRASRNNAAKCNVESPPGRLPENMKNERSISDSFWTRM